MKLNKPWRVQTVFCVDRNSYVRELIDSSGDLIAELKFETTEKPQPNKHESLLINIPDLVEALIESNEALKSHIPSKNHEADSIISNNNKILNLIKGGVK